MLKIGDKAPQISLKDSDGNDVSLSQLKGKKVVLYFYPKDDTPGCTREAIDFTKLSKEFAAHNAVILGLSKDSVESHKKFCEKYQLSGLTLLSDTEGKTVESYGVWQEKQNYGKTYMGIVRTTYLLDVEGNVSKVWSNVKVDGHGEAVLEAVKAL